METVTFDIDLFSKYYFPALWALLILVSIVLFWAWSAIHKLDPQIGDTWVVKPKYRDNPWEEDIAVYILDIKDGWVKFTSKRTNAETTCTINLFIKVFKLK